MTVDELHARVVFSAMAEPGDPVLGALLAAHGWAHVWEAITKDEAALPMAGVPAQVLDLRLQRWRARVRAVCGQTLLDRSEAVGARVLLPGGPDWPVQLDDLGPRRPCVLWVRGIRDLRHGALRSVAVVGSRAASHYGLHVATELGFALSEQNWTVLSGGAFGIDAAAHQAALTAAASTGTAAGGTVAVLPCGIDLDYPRGNQRLFAHIAAQGNLVSELPPGVTPTRRGFLVRNRILAALVPGVVVVEAGRRSGAMNTIRHALDLNRVTMAVPGPVTSALSMGCHTLLREAQAVCVTDASEVLDQVGPLLGSARPEQGRRLVPAPDMDPLARQVLAAVPAQRGVGPATIAATVGCDLATALRQLGLLAAAGHVERAAGGWRRSGQE